MVVVSPQDPWYQVAEVVRLVRRREAQTRPELADATRLGRNVITQRIQAAEKLGLVEPDGTGRSRGGRAADVWTFRADAGHLLVGLFGVRSFRVALTDLAAGILAWRELPLPEAADPEASCRAMADALDGLLAEHGADRPWGVGIGMPAPVDFSTGQSVDPVASSPEAPRWPVDFDTRGWFTARFGVPVWVDAVANLCAYGAAAAPGAPDDLIFVRVGTGLGAGLVSAGRLHRGATWLAGELGHITIDPSDERVCLCGRAGCLGAYVGAWPMVGDGRRAAAAGESPYLAGLPGGAITLDDIAEGARLGDRACIDIVTGAARRLGVGLAGIISWFNPASLVVGGFSITQSPLFWHTLERTLWTSVLGASIAALDLRPGDPDQREGIVGAASMVAEGLLSPGYLAEWAPLGSPAETPSLLSRQNQE